MIEFPQFLAEVSGLEPDGTRPSTATPRAPYRWQETFAQACLAGNPPRVVGVPTGSGKTTAVDALVWALAAQVAGGGKRTLGVRVVWAIDRRILVDEVHEHASRLCRRLDLALLDPGDPLHETAAALASLSGDRPLLATRWRGGLDERPELQSPLQPEVITSTVAQIGSRLLFRGYGVGRRSLSLAAGLAACDTTICLDEVHLADPFRQTTERIVAMQGEKGSRDDDLPALRLVELTATPRDEDAGSIGLSDDDKRQLGPRWQGTKSARLVTPESDKEGDRIKALVAECLDLLAADATTLACVVNTVARARRVWSTLKAKLGDGADLGLLIGPQRQADRDRFLSSARRSVLFDGATPEKPLVVVATQTFEVGLDVDVEALVTESASSSALVQRLGRLNRTGRSTGTAVIVRDSDSWLYREDEKLAWAWLESRQGASGEIDVSVAALHDDPDRPAAPTKPSDAPLLTEDVVAHLVQTSPIPHRWCDPDVESFLKGAASDPTADVEICWRSDLRLDAVEEGGIDYSKMLVKLVPPDRRELLKLNVLNARSLLAALLNRSDAAAARTALSDVDVEGEAAVKVAPAPAGDDSSVQFLVARHGEIHSGAAHAGDDVLAVGEIAPGDLLILPAKMGGCDDFGLNPQADKATDVGPDVDRTANGLPSAIRLTPGALKAATAPRAGVDSACGHAWKSLGEHSNRSRRAEVLRHLVAKLTKLMPQHPALAELAQRLEEDEDQPLSLRLLGPVEADGTPSLQPFEEEEGDDVSGADEDEEQALTRGWVLVLGEAGAADELERAALEKPSPPTLAEHNLSVRHQLEEYTKRLDLPPQVRDSLLLAAATHDLGKADPRFQDFLHGGRAPLGATPIAKSDFGTRDPRTSRLAAKVSGLPTGFRHEVESVAIVADAARQSGAFVRNLDLDLVLACVSGHHGLGLPFPEVAIASDRAARPFGAEVDGVVGVASGDGLDGWDHGEWLERFWGVIDRYGPWRFCYLLGLLILADRVVSSKGD